MNLVEPFREIEVYKENEYKVVRLMRDHAGMLFVAKRFQGHPTRALTDNAGFLAETLSLFSKAFGDFMTVPRLYGISESGYEVHMEYLPELLNADPVGPRNLPSAQRFFATCYSLKPPTTESRSIRDSIYCSPRILNLLDSDFPQAIGLKGDLWLNLCQAKGRLILADLDTVAIEPLGLSEFILYAEILGASNSILGFRWILPRLPAPVALKYLTRDQALTLLSAADEVNRMRMEHLSKIPVLAKSYSAQFGLKNIVNRYY